MRWFLPVMCALTLASSARAHNGYGIAPIYVEPFGLILSDGTTPIVLKWTAREAHPEQFYRLMAQQSDFPPTPSPPSVMRVGTRLEGLAADALTYEVPLDVSGLASGAWRIYADFDEPPTCVELEQAPALIIIQRPGDPPPFGVFVTSPTIESPIVDAAADFTIEAISASAVRVTVEAGDIIRDPEFPQHQLCVEFTWTPTLGTIFEDVPLVPDPIGANRWRLDATWDTRDVPDGQYLFRVTAEDADGNTQVLWARRFFNVEHPRVEPELEPAVESADDVGVDAGAEVERAQPKDDGCAGGGLGAMWLIALVLVQRLSSRSR